MTISRRCVYRVGHHILSRQAPADPVGAPRGELRLPLARGRISFVRRVAEAGTIDLPGIPVAIEGEPRRQRPELLPSCGCGQDHSREATAVGSDAKASMRLAAVVVPEEACTRPAHRGETRTTVAPEHPRLPEPVEALDVGVPARLPRGDEPPVHPAEQAQAQHLGEGEAMGGTPHEGELVVHLADLGDSEFLPGVQEVGAEGLGALVAGVARGHRPADQLQGVEGEEPRDPPGAPDMARADEVGLLHRAHAPRPWRRTGPAAPASAPPLPLGTAVVLQDPPDRPETGEPADPPLLQLPADGLSAPTREGRPPRPVGHQLRSHPQDQRHHPGGSPAPNPPRSPRLLVKPGTALASVPPPPLGQPNPAPAHRRSGGCKAAPAAQHVDSLAASCVLTELSHCAPSVQKI